MYSLYELSMCAAQYGKITLDDLEIPKITNPVCCNLVKIIIVSKQSRTMENYNVRIVYHYAIVFDCVSCLRTVLRSQTKTDNSSLYISVDEMCFDALISQSIECLKFSISAGAVWTPLACIVAINAGSVECLRYAISAGAPYDSNTMYSAVRSGNIEYLKILGEFDCPVCETVYFSAIEGRRVDMLEYLVKLAPPISRTLTMMHSMAIGKGVIECLEYLLKVDQADRDPVVLTTMAVVSGRVECLRVLLDHGMFEPTHACNISADANQLECLTFAHENGAPWDETTCDRAANSGSLSCLQFARENGCPWDPDSLMMAAIRIDSVECLEYVHRNARAPSSAELLLKFAATCRATGCFHYMASVAGFDVTATVVRTAARTGNVNLMRYVHANWPDKTADERLWNTAASYGQLEVLQYLYRIQCPRPANACGSAAGHGYLQCLKFLVYVGFECTANTFARAVPDIGCMRFLMAIKCPMTEAACARAARKGSLQSLRFARENGCPWDHRTYEEAYRNRHTECFKYAMANGCPTSKPTTVTQQQP